MGFLATMNDWASTLIDYAPIDSLPFGDSIKTYVKGNNQRFVNAVEKGSFGDGAAAFIGLTMGPLFGSIANSVVGSDGRSSTESLEQSAALTSATDNASRPARIATSLLESMDPVARSMIVNGVNPKGLLPLMISSVAVLDELPNGDPVAQYARTLLATCLLTSSISASYSELSDFSPWYDAACISYATKYIKVGPGETVEQKNAQALKLKATFRPFFYALYTKVLELTSKAVPATLEEAISVYYGVATSIQMSEVYISSICGTLDENYLTKIGIDRPIRTGALQGPAAALFSRMTALVSDVQGALNKNNLAAQEGVALQVAIPISAACRQGGSKGPSIVRAYLQIAVILGMNHSQRA